MIDSPANPIVKSLKALSESKARRANRQFVVEGVRSVEDGLRSGCRPDVCLYSPELLDRTERGMDLLQSLNLLPSATLHEASPRAIQAATDTITPQGIVAAFPFMKWDAPVKRAEPTLTLICDDISDPGNMGTLLRTAEAAGVHAVWTTPRSVDIYNPKVVRAAMGTHFRLPIYGEKSWNVIMRDMVSFGIERDRLFCTDKGAELPYDAVDWRLPCALVVSNEAHGPSPKAREICDVGASITIPMSAGTESLNAAIAGAVVMFEAARQRRVDST